MVLTSSSTVRQVGHLVVKVTKVDRVGRLVVIRAVVVVVTVDLNNRIHVVRAGVRVLWHWHVRQRAVLMMVALDVIAHE